ncbi:MAG TPA: serine hydrolase domain-containing protein [Novosphingobium sp.]|nr:serine hydrolase domain-containing protein [Novosphingobium sp.]
MMLSRRAIMRGSAMMGAGALLGTLPFGRALAFAADAPSMEAQWPAVTALLDKYVIARQVPGMVAALGWGTAAPGYIARGFEGFDDPDKDGADSLFRAYSMTKPVTGMAAMMLIDEGKLGMDQKIADFIPEFANPKVAIDADQSLDAVPAKTQITIRQLMTHTAGLGYAGISRNKVGAELVRLGVIPAAISRYPIPGLSGGPKTPGPDEFARLAASVPLIAEPGTAWRYSMGLDILGIVIQRASGAPSFAQFLADRMFGPAGMTSSWFQVPASEKRRLTTNYGLVAGTPLPIDAPDTSIYLDPPAFAFGGAGLVTTPADYDKFLGMVANGGMVGGKRVMSEAAVRLGTSNLIADSVERKGTFIDGAGFGAGGRVGIGADAGTYGWAGAAGTVGFTNTRIGLRAGVYVQYMPSESLPIQRDFPIAVLTDLAALKQAA